MKNLIAPAAAALLAVAPMASFAQAAVDCDANPDADACVTAAPASQTTVLVGPNIDEATALAIGLGGLLLVAALGGGSSGTATTTTTTTTTTP